MSGTAHLPKSQDGSYRFGFRGESRRGDRGGVVESLVIWPLSMSGVEEDLGGRFGEFVEINN